MAQHDPTHVASSQKALMLEMKSLQEEPVEGFKITLVDEADLYNWEVAIFGPPNTHYEGGYFKVRTDWRIPPYLILPLALHQHITTALSELCLRVGENNRHIFKNNAGTGRNRCVSDTPGRLFHVDRCQSCPSIHSPPLSSASGPQKTTVGSVAI